MLLTQEIGFSGPKLVKSKVGGWGVYSVQKILVYLSYLKRAFFSTV